MGDQDAGVQATAFVAPLLPGKTKADRQALASCGSGERQADYEASRRQHGITQGVGLDPEHPRAATSPSC